MSSYNIDAFRADIAARLQEDPWTKISIQVVLDTARPLFDSIRNECPALFERLKYFVNSMPATAMTINASAEFPRFGIIGVRCDTEAGLCNSRDLKSFLTSKNLLFVEQRKDRFGAIAECERVDDIIRDRLRQNDVFSEPLSVKCTWVRNRSSDMIFVSPLTLMLAIMNGQNTNEFKRYAGILHMLVMIVEDEQSIALKGVISLQRDTITTLLKERNDLMYRLEEILDTTHQTYRGIQGMERRSRNDWQSYIKPIIVCLILYAMGTLMKMTIMEPSRSSERLICQQFQLPDTAWSDDQPSLPMVAAASDIIADNTFFNSVATMAQETHIKQTMAMCAMFSSKETLHTWESRFTAVRTSLIHSPMSYIVQMIDS